MGDVVNLKTTDGELVREIREEVFKKLKSDYILKSDRRLESRLSGWSILISLFLGSLFGALLSLAVPTMMHAASGWSDKDRAFYIECMEQNAIEGIARHEWCVQFVRSGFPEE